MITSIIVSSIFLGIYILFSVLSIIRKNKIKKIRIKDVK